LAALTDGLLTAAFREARELARTAFFFFITDPLYLSSRHHRPKLPSAQKMYMQVIHLLAAMCIAIDDQPIAALGDALLSCKIACHDEHVANQRFILVGNIIGCGYGFIRDNEYMHRRRRADVQKRNHARVAVQHGRRQVAGDDLLKKRRHFIRLR
jgi:hypothetical protein